MYKRNDLSKGNALRKKFSLSVYWNS